MTGRGRTTSSVRRAVVAEVAAAVGALAAEPVVCVGVDGRDGAGKSVFADELAGSLRAGGREVVCATIDRFHHPRSVRYRRGRWSPEGFYLDSYDLDAVRRSLLDPVAPGGDGRVVLGIREVATDRPRTPPPTTIPSGGVLIVDGIFLHRPELVDAWDLSVYLAVSATTGLARCAARDGTPADLHDPRNRRYVGGQRLYHVACDPLRAATIVIDNEVLDAPVVVRRSGGRQLTTRGR